MARLYRDAFGVPHLRAASVTDLARAQGEVTARDRTWQLEHLRRRATGTTAAVLGAPALPWDRLARRTRLVDLARRASAALDEETRSFVAAYVEGVNTGLATARAPELDRLRTSAEPWEEWTPLAVFAAQHLLFASLPGKLWAARAREVLGDGARLLSHEGPSASGSNAWAVGGERTASGLPLVGGDPHRVIEHPGVYVQVRLACEDPEDLFDVVGFAFPGLPGVQHFAHAGGVAWAITNGMADYQDVYAERLRRVAGGGSRVEALGPDGWEPTESWPEQVEVRGAAPEQVEVVVTRRGPVVEGGPEQGHGLALRTAADALGDLGLDALLPLLRARTVDDVDAALDRWVEPVNNLLVADTSGAVRYRLVGRVPVRAEANRQGPVPADDPAAAWTGWLDPRPWADVPPDGQVVTANERRGPESTPVGTAFAAPHRARRLAALLDGRTGLTGEDFAAVHDDALSASALALRDALVRGQQPEPAGVPVRDAILAWDGRMEVASTGAAAFAAWRSALVRRLAAEPALAPLAEPRHDPVLAPWLDPVARVAGALEALAAAGTPYGIDVRAHARAALGEAAGHPATWGATHVVVPVHAFAAADDDLEPPPVPRLPVAGDSDCVRCTASLPGLTDECSRGSVARYVWDLADRQAGGWVVPLGAAGDPAGPHARDQLPLWAAGRLAPIVTDWERLVEEPS